MAEYIEREITCKDCLHFGICVFHYKGNENEQCKQFINAADVVEVVRCKDCKHFEFAHDCNFHAADENGTPIFVRENDFCSYGERRNDA